MRAAEALRGWLRAGVLALLAGAAVEAAAQDSTPAVPPLTARVTDLTGTLDTGRRQALEQQLAELEQRKGAQLAVLMVATTGPEDIAAYAIRVFDAWKLGRKDIDDGALLLVAKDDRSVRIEVARGLEGAIPDAAAARIIREYLVPRFRSGDFDGGIEDAVAAMVRLVDGEPLPEPWKGTPRERSGSIPQAILFGLIAALWTRAMFQRLRTLPRGALTGLAGGGLAWLMSGLLAVGFGVGVLAVLIGLLGGGGGRFANRGGWGGFGDRGFGGGGFGGGGRGGFGGGGFSGGGGISAGGGASGRW